MDDTSDLIALIKNFDSIEDLGRAYLKLDDEIQELCVECNTLSERVVDLDNTLLSMETLYTESKEHNKKLKSLLKYIIGTYL